MRKDNKRNNISQLKNITEERLEPINIRGNALVEQNKDGLVKVNQPHYDLLKTDLNLMVAIPCYNTEHSIGDVVKETLKYVNNVIVINDGSIDKTAEIAAQSGAQIVSHCLNRGYGGAIKSCIEAFQLSDADILVTIDGDGQHDPNEIPLLINPILEHKADLVIGSRFMDNGVKIPSYRKFGISIINSLWNFGSKI